MQKEMRNAGLLLDQEGHLKETGWARSLLKTYRRSDIKAEPWRIKEWDYYLVANNHYGVALTMADNSYMGMISASVLWFDEGKETTSSIITPLPMGSFRMPESSQNGKCDYYGKEVELHFIKEKGMRHLICHFLNFKEDMPLDVDIVLTDEPEESMVIATPFKKDPEAFYYNQKINCMRADGMVQLGRDVFNFSKENSFGTLDWGRGVWTYANTWYWSSASGIADGHTFGWNFGYGFGDTNNATENMLFFDGRAHKLNEVKFHMPKLGGKDKLLKPWRITSDDGRVRLLFEPVLDRASDTNALIVRSNQHQVFGKFTGICRLDDGTKVIIHNFMGFAEKVKNRW